MGCVLQRLNSTFIRSIMFKNTKAKLLALAAVTLASSGAMAASDGISAAMGAVDFTTVSTLLASVCLVVVAVKLIFKGPDIAGRVIKKF